MIFAPLSTFEYAHIGNIYTRRVQFALCCLCKIKLSDMTPVSVKVL